MAIKPPTVWYEITYTKPTDVTVRTRVEKFYGKGLARDFMKRAREYSGSYDIEKVERVTAKTRTVVDL